MPPKKKPKGKPKGGESGGTTVGGMLAALGIADPTAAFEACVNFEDEFRVVKKAYLKIVLKEHPDKGGDRERFEAVQTAWETLSTMKAENKLGSLKLAKTFERSAAREHAHAAAHRPSSTPDWSFYAEAFKDSGLPLYKVERAKSGRSRCEMREKEATADKKAVKRRAHTVCRVQAVDPKSKCFISNNAVRVGTMDIVSGAYGRFVHLECWRVPASVYKGLPSLTIEKDVEAFKSALATMEDVALAGARGLDDGGLTALALHVMNPEHWARSAKKRLPNETGAMKKKTKKPKKASSKASLKSVPVPPPERREGAVTVDLTGSSDDEVDLPVIELLVSDEKQKPRPAAAGAVVTKGAGKKKKNAKQLKGLRARRPAPRRRLSRRVGVRRQDRRAHWRVSRARRRRRPEPGQGPREGAHRVLRRTSHLRGLRKDGRPVVRRRARHEQGEPGARPRRDLAELLAAVRSARRGRVRPDEGIERGARADGGCQHHLVLLRLLGQRCRARRLGRRAGVRGAGTGARARTPRRRGNTQTRARLVPR